MKFHLTQLRVFVRRTHKLLGAVDTGVSAGLKCRDLTDDMSPQSRGFAEVLISRLNRACLKGPLNSASKHLSICMPIL